MNMVKLTVTQDGVENAVYELYRWQRCGGDNFTCQLYALMCKADAERFERLAQAFPNEGVAFMLWMSSPDQDTYFESWGVSILKESPTPPDESHVRNKCH